MVSASWTSLCDWRPLMSAMNPTPQESFSCAGSNKPKPCAPIVVLALLAHPRRACTARSRFGASLPAPPLLPSTHAQEGREGAPEGEPHSRRQPSCRLAASGCLFRRRPTRPRPGGWPSHLPLPLFSHPLAERPRDARVGHKLGQQCCPMRNMANSGLQTQEHRSLLSWPTRREKGERIKAFGFGPFAARSSAMSGGGKWTTAGAQAQWALPIEEAAIRSLRRPDESTRVVETKIGWRFEGKCPGLRRRSRRLAAIRQPNGATTHQT